MYSITTIYVLSFCLFFFFKQKTAYEMRISDWSSDVCSSDLAQAAVSPEQAARLGKDLTPTGAEQAGNADGTIPAWTGGITTPPAGYKVGMFHPDPFPNDKIEFTITPQNYKQYADKLTVGQKAMFEKYSTFKMNVYQTRRTASFPKRTYEMTKINATKCQLVANGEGVQNRSEEHTSELQSLMSITYAVFCLKKKNNEEYTTT